MFESWLGRASQEYILLLLMVRRNPAAPVMSGIKPMKIVGGRISSINASLLSHCIYDDHSLTEPNLLEGHLEGISVKCIYPLCRLANIIASIYAYQCIYTYMCVL